MRHGTMNQVSTRYAQVVLLLTILVLGAILRFYLVDYRGLWNDEAVSIRYWSGTPIEVISNVAALDIHPPFWFLVVNFSQRLGGNSDFAFRLPSVIAGILTVFVVYILGRNLFSGQVGLIAALLTSVSSFHLYYSQEARMYAIYGLLSTITFWLLWMALVEGQIWWWIGFALTTTLNCYTHYFAFLLLFAQGLFAGIVLLETGLKAGLLRQFRESSALGRSRSGVIAQFGLLVLSLGIVCVGFLPWAPALSQDIAPLADYGRVSLDARGIWSTSFQRLLPLLLRLFSGYDTRMIPWYAFFAVVGIVSAPMARESRQMLLCLLVLAVPFAFSLWTGTTPHPRYLVFCFPAFLLLTSRGFVGVTQVLNQLRTRGLRQIHVTPASLTAKALNLFPAAVGGGALAAFLICNSKQLFHYYEYDMLGSWREIGDFLTANATLGDAIFVTRGVSLSRYLPDDKQVVLYRGDGTDDSFTWKALQEAYAEDEHVWIVIPTHVWCITPELKTQVIEWTKKVPHVGFEFGGWDFPGAVVFYVSSFKTSEDLLSAASNELDVPQQPQVNLSLAHQFESAGMFREAMYEYERTLLSGSVGRLQPGYLDMKMRGEIHMQIADMLLANGRAYEAIEEYKRAIALGASSYRLFSQISDAYQYLDDEYQAGCYRDKALRLVAQPRLGNFLDLETLARNYRDGVSLSDNGELDMLWEGRTSTYFHADAGTYALRIRARGQQGCELWPVLKLHIDDYQLGEQKIASTKVKTYEFPEVLLHYEGEHTLSVEFVQTGNCRAVNQDINLYVHGIYLKKTGDGPASFSMIRALDLVPLAEHYHGGVELNDRRELGMYWAGKTIASYDLLPGTYTIQIRARGQQGCGLWPILRLYIDEKEIGEQEVTDTELKAYEFPDVFVDTEKQHSIGVEFVGTGNCDEQGQDVNLFVREILLERNAN